MVNSYLLIHWGGYVTNLGRVGAGSLGATHIGTVGHGRCPVFATTHATHEGGRALGGGGVGEGAIVGRAGEIGTHIVPLGIVAEAVGTATRPDAGTGLGTAAVAGRIGDGRASRARQASTFDRAHTIALAGSGHGEGVAPRRRRTRREGTQIDSERAHAEAKGVEGVDVLEAGFYMVAGTTKVLGCRLTHRVG